MTGRYQAYLERKHNILRGQVFVYRDSEEQEETASSKSFEVVELYKHFVLAQRVNIPEIRQCFSYWQMNINLGRGNPDMKLIMDRDDWNGELM